MVSLGDNINITRSQPTPRKGTITSLLLFGNLLPQVAIHTPQGDNNARPDFGWAFDSDFPGRRRPVSLFSPGWCRWPGSGPEAAAVFTHGSWQRIRRLELELEPTE